MIKTATSRKFKIFGELFLAIPGLVFIIFAVGEMSAGIAGSLGHLVQLIPIIIFALACWYFPKKGGVLLISVSVIFAILYFLSFSGAPLAVKLVSESLLFLPPIIGGLFFILAGKKH